VRLFSVNASRNATEPAMSQELLFDLDNVRVTPYVARFGHTSYQIAGISSVRAITAKRISRVAMLVFLLGVGIDVFALLTSHTEEQSEANFPVAATGLGIILLSLLIQVLSPRKVFKLVLRTHGGDVEVLTSGRSKFVLDVKDAIETAFIAHAQRSGQQRSS
jgi:hypothetical protein